MRSGFAGLRSAAVAIVWASAAAAATQATYYVSPGGSDSNPGTEAQPFATLAKARDVVRTVNGSMTGDIVVYLRGGWYFLSAPLTFSQSDSGTNGYNVVYRAYPGEYPVISGGRQIAGWTLHDAGKNIWKASSPGLDTRQLYVNCVRAIRARKGSGLPGAAKTATGYTTTDTSMQNWGNISDVEFVYNAREGGTGGSKWTERRCGVESITGTTITMKQPAWNNCTRDDWQAVTNPTDIENAYELLDQPGEWYLDRPAGVVYYIPRPGEDLQTARVIAPVLEVLVSGTGTLDTPIHNIQFVGITFAHATWLRPSGNDGFPEIQANYCWGIGWTPGNVVFRTARAIRFERCVFKHLGAIGLELVDGSQDCAVAGCVFTDISGNCIKIGKTSDPTRSDTRARDSRNQVVNCYIHHAPCEYRGGVGVFAGYVSDLTVEHNEICWTPYSAVSVGWGWGTNSYARNNQINYNDFHHWVERLSDGGAIYSLSAQPDSAWHHNYGHDMPWGAGSMERGWYTDEGSAYIDIHHNVIARIAQAHWYSAWTGSIHDIQIRDNFTDTPNYENNGTNCIMTNNTLVTDGQWPQAALDIMAGAGIEAAWADVKGLPCACSVTDPDPNAPPRLVSATAVSATEVRVVFSEAVEQSSATATANYSISGGVTIQGAALDAIGTVVTLTTSALAEDVTYTLTVNNVRDRSSPPRTIAPNSQTQFVRPGLSTGLLGWWKFDETSGSTAADSSGNGFHASVTGATWTAGKLGGALDLDAADSVSMPGPTGAMAAFSVAFWINPRSHSDWNQVVGPDWPQFLFHTTAGGAIYCGIDHGSWTSRFSPAQLPNGTLELNTWQHFVFTYEGGTANFYKNGALLATKTQESPDPWTSFGISDADGLFDDLRIYGRALSSTEVQALYATGGASPAMSLSPTSLSFSATAGGANPAAQNVSVANSGSGTLADVTTSISYGSGSNWLTVTRSGSGNSQTLANSVNISGLAAGTYTATVSVYSTGASNSPRTYTVTLSVTGGADSDSDGLPDSWETQYFGNPAACDPNADADSDGLTNREEYQRGTNPTDADSDDDGMSDGFEAEHGFDPSSGDQDGNGVPDGDDDWDSDGIPNRSDSTPGSPTGGGGGGGFSCAAGRSPAGEVFLALLALGFLLAAVGVGATIRLTRSRLRPALRGEVSPRSPGGPQRGD